MIPELSNRAKKELKEIRDELNLKYINDTVKSSISLKKFLEIEERNGNEIVIQQKYKLVSYKKFLWFRYNWKTQYFKAYDFIAAALKADYIMDKDKRYWKELVQIK